MGHRNQQGLALHPQTFMPWATEHAPQGGDELNAIEAGKNYGWPIVSYGRHYDGPRISRRFWHEGMEEPVGHDGLLYVLTEHNDAAMLRIEPVEEQVRTDHLIEPRLELLADLSRLQSAAIENGLPQRADEILHEQAAVAMGEAELPTLLSQRSATGYASTSCTTRACSTPVNLASSPRCLCVKRSWSMPNR